MKRVFALLCALALVLPMICTGAAAAESETIPEGYVFELLPDIMYLDDFDGFHFPHNGQMFYSEELIPDGLYNVYYYNALLQSDSFSESPILLKFNPFFDGESVIEGLWTSDLCSLVLCNSSSGTRAETFLQVANVDGVDGMYGSIVFIDVGSSNGSLEGSYLILTPVSTSGTITIDESVFYDFSYMNLAIIFLTSLGLSAGPAIFWFGYRYVKRKISSAFFNGKF